MPRQAGSCLSCQTLGEFRVYRLATIHKENEATRAGQVMQKPILDLLSLGALPSEKSATVDQLKTVEALVLSIEEPVTDQEAEAMVSIFGEDGCFGIAWSVLHLIETAPSWPINRCLANSENIWVEMLVKRSENAGLL